MKTLDLKGLTGEIITRFSPLYTAARQEWNRGVQRFPLIIVYCENNRDVSNAVIWSRKQQVPLRIRSGGHHYEGFSIGDGVLVIDISRMNAISFRDSMNITVQAGVKNEQLYAYVSSRGYPFPGGTCPTVGVSGYTLGGGWGLSSRKFGLGCDSLVELEMVDYKGRILVANEKQNSELFWACRGAGGGNFGVVVSLTYKVPNKVNKISLIQMEGPNLTQRLQMQFFYTWQQWLASMDSRMTMVGRIYNALDGGYGLGGTGFFYGSKEEALRLVEPLSLGGNVQIRVEELPFYEAIQKVEAAYPPYERFKSTGRFVNRTYSKREIESIISLLRQRAPGSVYAALSLYALGGKVAEVAPEETAFFYRDAHYIMGLQSVWEDQEYKSVNVKWLENRFPYLDRITTGSYVNFPYSELSDPERAYFGGNVPRLEKVKAMYDPYDVFSFPQSLSS
ncbi:FAD linked oxidase domain-containing protein [Fictibacillus macauensis ZFHKF-1]|uniref:FAD linked oxidase domain-containing protein n=1 Tax=Fictibacillus macauensis ZFHKF-1 TaxID=1196324 RepID=I8UD85_9BACL|nr:FAD-binding oxidoreductase [Fictibacillus macauensis]EIT84773.1 FAD linked oxidase domain-containing protein [Fictibacillus macauensis ZFHKF-1]